MLRPLISVNVLILSACAQSPKAEATVEPVNFDTCLITHMAAMDMLDAGALRDRVLASQTELLSDERLDERELASRTSTLMRAYAIGASIAVAEAEIDGVSPQALAADALSCGEALVQ